MDIFVLIVRLRFVDELTMVVALRLPISHSVFASFDKKQALQLMQLAKERLKWWKHLQRWLVFIMPTFMHLLARPPYKSWRESNCLHNASKSRRVMRWRSCLNSLYLQGSSHKPLNYWNVNRCCLIKEWHWKLTFPVFYECRLICFGERPKSNWVLNEHQTKLTDLNQEIIIKRTSWQFKRQITCSWLQSFVNSADIQIKAECQHICVVL